MSEPETKKRIGRPRGYIPPTKNQAAYFIKKNKWAVLHRRLVHVWIQTFKDFNAVEGNSIAAIKLRKSLGELFVKYHLELVRIKHQELGINQKQEPKEKIKELENPFALKI